VFRPSLCFIGLFLGWTTVVAPASTPTPVLVELFTSEGCSDCPAADLLLDKLVSTQPVTGADIIALEQHVDYWDRLGWKDPFSSALFTKRQQEYGARLRTESIYTPQMVVDGVAEFVGSDANAAKRAISKSLAVPHGSITIAPEAAGRDRIVVTVTTRNLPAPERGDRADIIVALTEDHLKTDVKRGENHGRTLAHTGVVRQMLPIGEAAPGESATARGELSLAADWQRSALKVVAFVQERRDRRVLASAVVPLTIARQ